MGGAEGGGVALQASWLQGFDTLVLHQISSVSIAGDAGVL